MGEELREYWISGNGFTKIKWTPYEETTTECVECGKDWEHYKQHKLKNSTEKEPEMRSGNHFSASKSDDGEYTCTTCGGESFDFELFEAYGDEVGCLYMGSGGDPDDGNPKTPLEYADVQRARKHIEEMKEAMKRAGESAEKAAEKMHVNLHWEDEDEIVLKSATGDIQTYRTGGRWVTEDGIEAIAPSFPSVSVDRGGITYNTKDASVTTEMFKALNKKAEQPKTNPGSWLDRFKKRGS